MPEPIYRAVLYIRSKSGNWTNIEQFRDWVLNLIDLDNRALDGGILGLHEDPEICTEDEKKGD